MKTGAKVLVAAAILCFAAWGVLLSIGLQPLFAAPQLRVVYGEGEDFHADAEVFRKARNHDFLLLHLPHARPDHRWWTIDLRRETVARTGPCRSLGGFHFMLRGDLAGTLINNSSGSGEWSIRFSDNGVAFSGEGLTCRIDIPRT